MYSLRVVAPPTVEPVALSLFRNHLRDPDDDDAILQTYLSGARASLEKLTQRAFMPQTLAFGIDRFPCAGFAWRNRTYSSGASSSVPGWIDVDTIRLPRPGCLAVNSIAYLDTSGAPETLALSNFLADLDSEPARLTPASGFWWPTDPLFTPGTVKVTYVAGTYALPVTETLPVSNTATVQLSQAPAGGSMSISANSLDASFKLGSDGLVTLSDTSLNGENVTATYYAQAVPPNVVSAILLFAAHLYKNREAASDVLMKEIPMGVQSLMADEMFYGGAYEL